MLHYDTVENFVASLSTPDKNRLEREATASSKNLSEVAEAALYQAEEMVDNAASSRYTIPLPASSSVVRNWVRSVAMFYFYEEMFSSGASKKITESYDRTREELYRLSKGGIHINSAAPIMTEENSSNIVRPDGSSPDDVAGVEQMLSRDKLRGW